MLQFISIFSPHLCPKISIMYQILDDILIPITAKAVVHAGKKFSTRAPSTAACRCGGVQYRLLVLSSLIQSSETLTMSSSSAGVMIPPKPHSSRVVRLRRQRTFISSTLLASDW